MDSLPTWRDRLLPGLGSYQEHGMYESDIQVDFQKDELIVLFFNFKTRKSLRREITRKDLENWQPAKFAGLLKDMKREILE
jgi:hypothetical protein